MILEWLRRYRIRKSLMGRNQRVKQLLRWFDEDEALSSESEVAAHPALREAD